MEPSKIKAILKDHKLWLQSDGKQGKRANLEGANLQGACLDSADLWGADLWRADLAGANLQGACLGSADLQGANLQGACLDSADLQGANLQGACLEDANLQGAKFTANFKKAYWFECATFSEEQIPWVVLHPKYPKWADTLKWVKAEADAA